MWYVRILKSLVLAAFLAVLAAPSWAQNAPEIATRLSQLADMSGGLEGRLENGAVLDEDIEAERATLEESRQELLDIAEAAEQSKAPLVAELEALGPAPEDAATESEEIASTRARLTEEIAEVDTQAKLAQQEATRARALLDRLNSLRRERFTESLLKRQESPLGAGKLSAAWASISDTSAAIYSGATTSLTAGKGSLADRVALPTILALIALFIAFLLRRWVVDALTERASPDASRPRRIVLGIIITVARLLLPAVAVVIMLLAISGSWFSVGNGAEIVRGLIMAAAIVIGANALGRAFYSPRAPHLRISVLESGQAMAAHRALMVLAVMVAAHRLCVITGEKVGLSVDALTILNAAILTLGGLALWSFVHCARIGQTLASATDADGEATDEDEPETPPSRSIERLWRIVRFLALASAVLAPVLAIVGYYRASQFVFYPLVQSGALIGACLLIFSATKALTFAATAQQGDQDSPQQDQQGLLPVLIGFLLFVVAVPLLALIWGADATDLFEIWGRVVEGFQVGEVKISPVDFLLFAIVFAMGYIVTRMLQGVMRRSVLPLTRLDAGAKSATLAGIGYVGVVISALVAISTTGLDLSNIAIVAGALSVGIGFGLQNVVNNFVSGIILLIERPIKTGDWVEVGGKHGTVRKINVRSTEIQTFDRSTMFVPNADLISGTVTNWTHGDSLGRLIVPVGVAYGSDARKVEKILLEIAQGHPMLMRRPAPYVVMVGFGADSLDFEIRGVLRDVNWILNVGSDVRFSIYERFNEEGIEIPFAQRDLNIRNIGELREVLGGDAAKGKTKLERNPSAAPPPGEGAEPDADGDNT